MKRAKSILIAFTIATSLIVSTAGVLSSNVGAAPKNVDKGGDKIARNLRHPNMSGNGRSVNVVVQFNGPMSNKLASLLRRNGTGLKKHFQYFNSASMELPGNILEDLANFDEVDFVSGDDELMALGHVTSTTGADDVRAASNSADGATTLDGTGIGIAVLDSGIYSEHKSISTRVIYSKDFTGENRVDDPYGHGTHVAAAAAGNSGLYSGNYSGIAPNANLVNLRVLNSRGRSYTSVVLGALDWVYSNRSLHNIRVVNMSLGGPALASYAKDPLCIAVRRLVDAGVVVVAAAGNDGKDAFGRKQYGAIHAPGNEPSAITVGATNSYGTNQRNDDAVTTYSSRGPTRSFWTDDYGVQHYDNLIKPDLVAPGNK
ncbi:MAG TPA: S8 family serine peptidase, partial [Pyrinomonadaceae bacterium]|nr:S8 family serine peptidase [Pyrinomonadaceae bacterium]